MKLPAFLATLPRAYLFALAASLAVVVMLRAADFIGHIGALGLATLAVIAVIETAILKKHIPFNYG